MEIEHCTLCPRQCGVYRESCTGKGACGMGADAVVARAALHFWEEPCISGTCGSGAVFFTGCPLGCIYCQNYTISAEKSVGKRVSPEELAGIFRNLAGQGAHNINLVTPTHFIPSILRALSIWKPNIPVVYNCGGYETLSSLRMLEGHVDIYLPDLKYADSGLAALLSGAPDYPETAKAAVREMVRQTGPAVYDKNGILQRGTLVRHLILPGHTRNSIAVLEWLAANFPAGVPVSLMAQYIPCGRASDFPGMNRRITLREYRKVESRLFALGLDGYVQDRESSSKKYIPSFNLEGVQP
ncbi:MAG: radical SAM protein [Oscillospiraceae bacterium]|nr:radical SAM protein [Oscillospiraceae bacterium]